MRQQPELPSERSFAIVFFVVFLVVAVYPMFGGGSTRVWSLGLAAVILALGLLYPRALRPFNVAWSYIGQQLSKLMTPVIMMLIYAFAFVPTGLVMRLLRRDLLRLKLDRDSASYWIERETPQESMKNQF